MLKLLKCEFLIIVKKLKVWLNSFNKTEAAGGFPFHQFKQLLPLTASKANCFFRRNMDFVMYLLVAVLVIASIL